VTGTSRFTRRCNTARKKRKKSRRKAHWTEKSPEEITLVWRGNGEKGFRNGAKAKTVPGTKERNGVSFSGVRRGGRGYRDILFLRVRRGKSELDKEGKEAEKGKQCCNFSGNAPSQRRVKKKAGKGVLWINIRPKC